MQTRNSIPLRWISLMLPLLKESTNFFSFLEKEIVQTYSFMRSDKNNFLPYLHFNFYGQNLKARYLITTAVRNSPLVISQNAGCSQLIQTVWLSYRGDCECHK